MSRQQCVEHITSRLSSVVEHLLDECGDWPEGEWLASAERRVRDEMQRLAGQVLEGLIRYRFGRGYCGSEHVDEQGQRRPFKEYVARRVKTVVGTVTIRRASYHSKSCEPSSVRPLDEQLGLRGDCSEGLEELMAYTAGQLTYEETVRLLSKTLGVPLSRTKVRRVAGQWGQRVSAVRRERLPREPVPKRVAVALDGAMIRTAERRRKRKDSLKQQFCEKWRESKLGVIYRFDRKGKAQRDHRYVATLGGRDSFGEALWQHIEASGADRAQTITWLGDGAEWIWTLKQEHLPHAVEVLDFRHASEHLDSVATALYGERTKRSTQWSHDQRTQLKAGHADHVIKQLQQQAKRLGRPRRNSPDDDPRKIVADNLRYFQRNRHRMNYKLYRQLGYPISSGVVESGCKHVIAQRMRITASMSWHDQTADAVLQLRCLIRSNQWDDFWRPNRSIA
jgi:hypothetical protein